MALITSVDSDTKAFWAQIITDMCRVEWVFESEPLCCEKFGVDLSMPLEELVGKKFKNIDFDGTRITISLVDEEPMIVHFYNNQNGYYSHNLDIYIDSVLRWNVAL